MGNRLLSSSGFIDGPVRKAVHEIPVARQLSQRLAIYYSH